MQLSRRRVEQVRAADDVRHALCVVVDHHRELIGPLPVGASKHEVAHLFVESVAAQADAPVDPAHGCRSDAHAPGARAAAERHAVAAGSRIRFLRAGERSAARGDRVGDLASRAAARVDVTVGNEPVEGLPICIVALALVDDLGVVAEAQPCKRLDNRTRGAGHLAGRVEILDAQQPASAVRARI